MIALGKIIQDKRIASSLDVIDISNMLKIKQEFIIAIEQGDMDYFSSSIYYFGYLKQYLKLLQIDEVNISTISIAQSQKLEINIPLADSFNPSIFFAAIAFFCSILIYNLSDNYISSNVISPIALEIQNHTTRFVELRN